MGMERMFSWPGWETVRLLGEGSFGRVYEIERKIVDFTEKAALKVISIPHSENEIDDFRLSGYSDSSIRKRYEEHLKDVVHEYTLMKGLKECPNVVQCEDVRYEQHEDGIGWDILIKMELLTPLMQSLPMDAREKTVVQLGKDLCNALAECEKRNILHRDIKPQNIFVSSGGVYKLGDFGIAKAAERTTGGTKTGTYKFMAPEVYNNEPYGPKADIYSLGMVLYWLLNDRREPFVETDNIPTAAEEEHARQRRFSGEELPYPKNGSIALKRLVCRACSANPDQRFRDAEEMLHALEQAEDQTVGVWTSASVRGDDATGGEKPWLKWVAAALGAVLAGLMIAIGIKMYVNRNTPAETPSPSAAVTAQAQETEGVPQEVTAVIITDVDDTGEPLRLKTGTEMKLNIRTEPEGAQADVVWTSSNPDVVAVDDSGTITCISPGGAEITVSCGVVSSQLRVEVFDEPIVSQPPSTQVDTYLGAHFVVPSGFYGEMKSEYPGDGSSGQLAAGQMYEYHNDDLQMEIVMTEVPVSKIPVGDSARAVLLYDYENRYNDYSQNGSITLQSLKDNRYVMSGYVENGQTIYYEAEFASDDDFVLYQISFRYPSAKADTCNNIVGAFMNSFSFDR